MFWSHTRAIRYRVSWTASRRDPWITWHLRLGTHTSILKTENVSSSFVPDLMISNLQFVLTLDHDLAIWWNSKQCSICFRRSIAFSPRLFRENNSVTGPSTPWKIYLRVTSFLCDVELVRRICRRSFQNRYFHRVGVLATFPRDFVAEFVCKKTDTFAYGFQCKHPFAGHGANRKSTNPQNNFKKTVKTFCHHASSTLAKQSLRTVMRKKKRPHAQQCIKTLKYSIVILARVNSLLMTIQLRRRSNPLKWLCRTCVPKIAEAGAKTSETR